jgi:hypothetical protein
MAMPYLEMDELVALFGYKNARAAVAAIRKETFPVDVYRLAGRWVADPGVVNGFFEAKRLEGLASASPASPPGPPPSPEPAS